MKPQQVSFEIIADSLHNAKIYDRINHSLNYEEIEDREKNRSIHVFMKAGMSLIVVGIISFLTLSEPSLSFAITAFYLLFALLVSIGIVNGFKKANVYGMAKLFFRIADPATHFTVRFKSRTQVNRFFVTPQRSIYLGTFQQQSIDVKQIDFIRCLQVIGGAIYSDKALHLTIFVNSKAHLGGYLIDVVESQFFDAKTMHYGPDEYLQMVIEFDMTYSFFNLEFPAAYRQDNLVEGLRQLRETLKPLKIAEVLSSAKA